MHCLRQLSYADMTLSSVYFIGFESIYLFFCRCFYGGLCLPKALIKLCIHLTLKVFLMLCGGVL